MEDIKKIQEFFSNPIKENNGVDYSKLIDLIKSANNPKNLPIYYDSINGIVNIGGTGYDKGDLVKMFNSQPGQSLDIKTLFYKADQSPEETKNAIESMDSGIRVEIGKGYGNKPFVKYMKSLEESKSNPSVDKLLKVINTKKAGPEYKKALMDLIAMAEKKSGKTINTKKEALLALDYIEPTIKEEQSEDPVDTITMDVPLFIRMLEYAREDAKDDMDLHDVTEKANLLGKERGILQMEDYNEIVGTTESTPIQEMIKSVLNGKGIKRKK